MNQHNGIEVPAEESTTTNPEHGDILVDFERPLGRIKPLHGINNSPMTHGEPLPDLSEAGIPFVRLHDTAGAYGGTHFVDIPNIFPNFDADPDDPASYDFAFTDAYLAGLVASGVKIFYRLGVTIENHWKIKAYRIDPPKDSMRWARICAGIVRHYNEGWADGFQYGVEYWEIWNEPENPPMWTGTREQYFELYRMTANHLKERFPKIKVGGYASCGFYAVTRQDVGAFHESFVDYFEAFLNYVTAPETRAPLDFFSWHLYTADPHEIIQHAGYVAAKLSGHGLAGTENIFNEWNSIFGTSPDMWDMMKEMPGATFVAAAFCLMQRSPIDKAMYYDALPTRRYCGLFYFPSCRVTPTYYAFKAFNELHRLGTEVYSHSPEKDGIYVCAARSGQGKAVMLVNRAPHEQTVAFTCRGVEGRPISCLLTDRAARYTESRLWEADGKLTLRAESVMVLKYA